MNAAPTHLQAPGQERADGLAERTLRLLPYALLLPLVVVTWPFPRLVPAADPLPLASATGWLALTSVPAALLLVLHGPRVVWSRAAWLALLPGLVLVLAAFGAIEATDRFGRDRLLVHAAALLVAALGGAALDRTGRRSFARGLAFLALLVTLPALSAYAVERDPGSLAGTLGNVGPTHQAALAGTVIGGWLAVARRGWVRVAGSAAFAAGIAHALLAPVLAGILSVVVSLVASALLGAWPREVRSLRRGMCALAGAVLFVGIVSLGERPGTADPVQAAGGTFEQAASEEAQTDRLSPALGGAPVRLAVWRSTLDMIAELGPLDAGPGQFAAVFPPHRSHAELALSTGDRTGGAVTEVEHAHNDWLQSLCDFGWLGGLGFIGLLLAAVWLAANALGRKEIALAAGGTALLALVFNALLHSALLENPFAGFVAAGLFGVVARRGDRGPRALSGPAAWIALACVLAAMPVALELVRHGRGLATCLAARAELSTPSPSAAALEATLARHDEGLTRALSARPDSPLGLSIAASALAEREGTELPPVRRATHTLTAALGLSADPAAARGALYERLTEHRPHSVEALLGRAAWHARDGEAQLAREDLDAVAALDPENPALAFNLARWAVEHDDPVAATERLLAPDPQLDGAVRVGLALEAQRSGWLSPEQVLTVLAAVHDIDDPLPEHAMQLSGDASDETRSALLLGLAHHLWAREQAERGDYETSLRSYRQALRQTRWGGREGSPLVRAELAACARRAGSLDEAEAAEEQLAGSPARRVLLPTWAKGS